MINRNENRIGHSGTAILFVLCFFLVFIFHNHTKDSAITGSFRFQKSSLQLSAVPSKDIPQLSSLQGFISKVDVTNVKHFSEQLRLLTYNSLISQRIILLQKTEKTVKPYLVPGFKYHHLVLYSDDLPGLS
jgi:hypothetical protein